jgi:hypothetical protein
MAKRQKKIVFVAGGGVFLVLLALMWMADSKKPAQEKRTEAVKAEVIDGAVRKLKEEELWTSKASAALSAMQQENDLMSQKMAAMDRANKELVKQLQSQGSDVRAIASELNRKGIVEDVTLKEIAKQQAALVAAQTAQTAQTQAADGTTLPDQTLPALPGGAVPPPPTPINQALDEVVPPIDPASTRTVQQIQSVEQQQQQAQGQNPWIVGAVQNLQNGKKPLEQEVVAAPQPQIIRISLADEKELIDKRRAAEKEAKDKKESAGTGGAAEDTGDGESRKSTSIEVPKAIQIFNRPKEEGAQPVNNTTIARSPMGANSTQTVIASQETYIPSGSFLKATLIASIDAPTGANAEQNPHPVLLLVTDNAFLPNKMRALTKQCHILAAGYGDLSSERVSIRAEKMSCVLKDGTVVDTKLSAYVAGEDGKAGVRGRLISKEGALLARAAGAGALAGLSDGIAQASTSMIQTGSGTASSVDPQNVFKYGAASGASSAMTKLAEYYIKAAEKMFPILEVSAGREVSVILLDGVTIAQYNPKDRR